MICLGMFVVSIPFVLGNGVYLFQLFDQYVSTIPLLLIGLFEFIAIAWVYGVKRWVLENSPSCLSVAEHPSCLSAAEQWEHPRCLSTVVLLHCMSLSQVVSW